MNPARKLALATGALGVVPLPILVSCDGNDDGNWPPPTTTQLTVAADWNCISTQAWTQLDVIAGAAITLHSEPRGLAIASAVIHDVLNAIDHRYAAYPSLRGNPAHRLTLPSPKWRTTWRNTWLLRVESHRSNACAGVDAMRSPQ